MKALGLPQAKVAKEMGMTRQHLLRLLAGERYRGTDKHLVKLFQILNRESFIQYSILLPTLNLEEEDD